MFCHPVCTARTDEPYNPSSQIGIYPPGFNLDRRSKLTSEKMKVRKKKKTSVPHGISITTNIKIFSSFDLEKKKVPKMEIIDKLASSGV